ncbi:MAG: DNA primase [Myxococcales bacterium]|nr:DNA primase [Myxococcales bacterium]
MGRIPDETLQTIRDRVDIAELVGRYVTLKRAGRSHKGLCPFHQEKTPSFTVNPDRGIFHCFGCQESGNAFAFLMRHENLTFPEAVRILAGEVGVVIPESGGRDAGVSERLFAANDVAQRLFLESLAGDVGRGAREYLAGRGIDAEQVSKYGIGYAPPGWDVLVRALSLAEIPASLGEKAGLLKARQSGGHYDLFRERVTFPIRDVRGRVIGFGGRALGDGEPKYLNSPETPVFRKREGFYGFPSALEPIRRADRVVVVEGYFDQIALDRAGLPEAVATCGTALSEEHARNLRRRTRNVVLLFDGDEAGRRAALRGLELLLPHGLRVRAAALPAGEDPDSLLASRGADSLRALVDDAPPALRLAIDIALANGAHSPEGKADAVATMAPFIAKIPEPTERTAWAQQVALSVGGREGDVLATVRAVARGERPEDAARYVPEEPADPRVERQLSTLVQALLQHPACAQAHDLDGLVAQVTDPLWLDLLPVLFDACHKGTDPLAAAEDQLEPVLVSRLHALAAGEGPSYEDEAHAARALSDVVLWFERQRKRAAQRELTDRLRASPQDPQAVLRMKRGAEAS